MGPTEASHCLLQERASLASLPVPLANVQEVPRGSSKPPPRAQLPVRHPHPEPSSAWSCWGCSLGCPRARRVTVGRLVWVVPRGQVLGQCFETCFWPLTKARWGSLSSEIGERSELGLSTAFSQSVSVMTVTKEVASGRTESINDLSFIKENLKLHHFLCHLNFTLSFYSPSFFFFFSFKRVFFRQQCEQSETRRMSFLWNVDCCHCFTYRLCVGFGGRCVRVCETT